MRVIIVRIRLSTRKNVNVQQGNSNKGARISVASRNAAKSLLK